jgi:hypothetical protein
MRCFARATRGLRSEVGSRREQENKRRARREAITFMSGEATASTLWTSNNERKPERASGESYRL